MGAAAQPPHPCTTAGRKSSWKSAATLGENSSHSPPQSNPLQCATGSCRSGVMTVGITRREGDHLRGAFVVKPPAVAFHDSASPLHRRHPAVGAFGGVEAVCQHSFCEITRDVADVTTPITKAASPAMRRASVYHSLGRRGSSSSQLFVPRIHPASRSTNGLLLSDT